MFIVMQKTFLGKEKGKEVQKYLAGSTYNVECPELIKVIEEQKYGIPATDIDPFAPVAAPTEPTDTKEYGLAAHEIALLPVKALKSIIEEEALEIDVKGLKQPELATAVTEGLKTKYKGI